MTAKKRQRTTWHYILGGSKGGQIRVGWVHSPRHAPPEDVVRLEVTNADGVQTDQRMTPLEAMSVAAGLAMVVAHAGWSEDIVQPGMHFHLGVTKRQGGT